MRRQWGERVAINEKAQSDPGFLSFGLGGGGGVENRRVGSMYLLEMVEVQKAEEVG